MIRRTPKFTYLRFVHFFLKENAHLNFLFSMILLVVLSPYLDRSTEGDLGVTLVSSYNVLATLYFIIHEKRNIWAAALSTVIIAGLWFSYFGLLQETHYAVYITLQRVEQFGVSFLIAWAMIDLFGTIFYAKVVDINVIISSISGYIALGLMGAFAFDVLNTTFPLEFQISSAQVLDRHDMVYYSFVTMTTLGYGDLVPVGPLARGMAVLLTVTGQIYMTMAIAMLIGKYLGSRREKEDQFP